MSKKAWPDWDVYVRDKCVCAYCGLDGTKDIRIWGQLQIDHIIPKNLLGSDTNENKVVACTRCNNLKSHKDPRQLIPNKDETSFSREELIKASRQIIQEVLNKNDAEADYNLMLTEIRQMNT